MDLSFTEAEAAFAREICSWLADNVELPAPFTSIDDEVAWGRRWQATLAEGRWVGIHWPEAYGGRGAPPPVGLGPVDADPPVGGERRLPAAAPRHLVLDRGERVWALDVLGEPCSGVGRERFLVGREQQIHAARLPKRKVHG